MLKDNRIRIIAGHYGSGKTEFAVNYALKLKQIKPQVTIIDLDIINPYFRSREKIDLFEEKGIELISSSFGKAITADLPSLSANIFGPLQNKQKEVIMDIGGDPVGMKTLARYRSYLKQGEYDLWIVINANRPETSDFEKAKWYAESIQEEAKVSITGLINNTHMLEHTTIDDIKKGNDLVSLLSDEFAVPVKYISCIRKLETEIPKELKGEVFPIDMVMRQKWMETK